MSYRTFQYNEKIFMACFGLLTDMVPVKWAAKVLVRPQREISVYYKLINNSQRAKIQFSDPDKLRDKTKLHFNGISQLSCDPDDLVIGNVTSDRQVIKVFSKAFQV